MAVALLDKWIIDYMTEQKLAVPDSAIVIGQSAGGWAAIALSSQNLPSVKAIIAFAAGRGGRVGGKPNNNCAPDKLVEATAEFGRTARVPMLWIYIENDTYLRAGFVQANACGLHRRRRQCRISSDAAVRQRGAFLHRFPGRHPAMVATGQPIPRQASLQAMEADDARHARNSALFGLAVTALSLLLPSRPPLGSRPAPAANDKPQTEFASRGQRRPCARSNMAIGRNSASRRRAPSRCAARPSAANGTPGNPRSAST